VQRIELAVALVVCALAVITDLRERRIPNWLTSAALAAGLILASLQDAATVLWRLAAAAIVLAVAFVAHSFGMIGGGDGKLLAGIAILTGGRFTVEVVLWTLLLGGVFSALLLARRGQLLAVVTTLSPSASPSKGIPLAPIVAAAVVVTAVAMSRDVTLTAMLH
jgi:prepilin peptidase CpaA